MSVEQGRRNPPLKSPSRIRLRVAFRWCARLRLRWLQHAMERLEHQLADEFAALETAPLLRELELLRVEHDAQVKRLKELL